MVIYTKRKSEHDVPLLRSLLLILTFFSCTTNATQDTNIDDGFADAIHLSDSSLPPLKLTGQTTRKKYLLDIYRIAHYSDIDFEEASSLNVYQHILTEPANKQIALVFQRSLSAKQIQSALTKGVQFNCEGDEAERVAPDLEKFRQAIQQDVAKDDEFSLRWTKEGHLLAFFQNELVGTFDSPLLARLLWTMWFGEKSIVKREELIIKLNDASNSTQ